MTAPSASPRETAGRGFAVPRARPWSGWAESLAHVPLFADLPRRHLKKVADLADLGWHDDEKVIVRAGAAGDAFYAILEGRAQLRMPSGRSRMLGASDSFGELALIDGAPRSGTVVSVGGVSLARIGRSAFLKLLREEPEIAIGLARGLVADVRDVERSSGRAVAAVAEASTTSGEAELTPAGAPGAGPESTTVAAALPLLAGVPLFAELSRRHLRRVARVAEAKSYPDGATVVRVGARGAVFHVILQGRARAVTPAGHEHLLQWGESFGELSLIDGAPRSATVTAVGDLVTLRIARPAFLELLKDEPTIAVGLVRALVALLRDVEREESA
jgi:CRP/FNR family cyclic AMP-dependent transcriptional regulator